MVRNETHTVIRAVYYIELVRFGIAIEDIIQQTMGAAVLIISVEGLRPVDFQSCIPRRLHIVVERIQKPALLTAANYVHVSHKNDRRAFSRNLPYHSDIREHTVFLGKWSAMVKMSVETIELPAGLSVLEKHPCSVPVMVRIPALGDFVRSITQEESSTVLHLEPVLLPQQYRRH